MWLKLDVGTLRDPEYLTLFSYALPMQTPPALGGENIFVGLKYDGPSSNKWILLLKRPHENWQGLTSYQLVTSFTNLANSGWHHFAVTCKRRPPAPAQDYCAFYQNGESIGTSMLANTNAQYSVPPNGGSVILGQGQSHDNTLHHAPKHYSTGFEYTILMAEVRFWNVNRLEEQIQDNWNQR